MASGPRSSPPALMPIRIFIVLLSVAVAPSTRSQRPAAQAGIVDVVVGDQAHGARGDGAGQHALALAGGPAACPARGGRRSRCWCAPTAGSSPQSGHRCATASARRAARAWSSGRRSTIWLQGQQAGRGQHARPGACRRPGACAPGGPRSITSSGPASSEPTGAQSPLDRQHITVVAGAAHSAAATPVAASALKSRAPSRWMGTSPAAAATAGQPVHATTGRPTPPCGCSRC